MLPRCAAAAEAGVYLYHESKDAEEDAPIAALLPPPVLNPLPQARRRGKTGCERLVPQGWIACCPAEVGSSCLSRELECTIFAIHFGAR